MQLGAAGRPRRVESGLLRRRCRGWQRRRRLSNSRRYGLCNREIALAGAQNVRTGGEHGLSA